MVDSWLNWREEILAIGKSNPLLHFEPNTFGQIDLERGHPGGISQFIGGGQTLLSNLVRDPLAFSRALSAARRIKTKADRISANFGIETLHLVGGLVDFTADGFDFSTPILIWPISIVRKTDDFEIAIAGAPRVNPGLIDSLKACYGISLNQDELLARQSESSDLVPITVLNYLANLTGEKANLDIKRILVVGNFSTVTSEMLTEFAGAVSPLVSALTGEPTDGLNEIDVPELTLVSDADSTQMRIVSRALAGQSFAVETLPGCGYTQTVVNVVAGLVNSGKRVLVAAPRKQSLNELADRFSAVGLPGLGVRADSTWVDLIAAISRNEKAQPDGAEAARAERISAEVELDKYFDTLNSVDPVLGVSVSRILRELSKLSSMAKPALTKARIPHDQLLRHLDRKEAMDLLNEAYELGEFKYGPQDTAWYQAEFSDPAEITKAVSIAIRLNNEDYSRLATSMFEFIEKVQFKPAVTVEQWGVYLKLFTGIRDTLDRFVADVFDRPLTELIAATAPRKGPERTQMSGGNRRRLKKLAKDYLRAGMHVSDLHAALIAIQEQREQWQEYCTAPMAPQIPQGINDILISYQSFVADLDALQKHIDPKSEEPALKNTDLVHLQIKLKSLAEDVECLTNHGDRLLVTNRLRDAGLGDLGRDLGRLHTTRENLLLELDQAWWQSALESVIDRNGDVLRYTPAQIASNENRFRKAFDAQIEIGAKEVAHELSERWKKALKAAPGEAANLKELLKARQANLASTQRVSPSIWPVIAPAVLASPFEISKLIPRDEVFDCLVVLDAAGSTLAENLPALNRARQIIAFGDDAIAAPFGFELEPKPSPLPIEEIGESVFNEVRRIFGAEVLRRSYRTTSQSLGALINREFYQGRIQYVPTAAEYFGENSFQLDVVTEDNRAKTTIEGSTESLDGEVARVVDHIFNHALWHPEQSLLVASASPVHAERIRNAVVAGIQTRPNLAEFFDSHGREKFEVTSIAHLTHRIADRVIFSLGFGRTSLGAVLSNFGELSEGQGRRHLANLLVSARHQITVVSCFGAEDVPSDRLANGAALLKDLLLTATNKPESVNGALDPMLDDLNLRLKKLGATVDTSYAPELPLIASFGNSAAVIEPDWSIPGQNRTEKFHIRPGFLGALGWRYTRVYSFELFSDPQSVALRIAENLGMQVAKRPQPLFDSADRAFEDSDLAWGEKSETNDSRLRQDKPPHWS